MGKGHYNSLSTTTNHPLFLFFALALPSLNAINISIGIGIGIGGGGGGGEDHYGPPPPPTSPPEPQPCDFPNKKQYEAYKVIQRFKKTITCDPNNVTQTWFGYRPCKYQGFYCETPPGLTETPTIASVDFNGFRLCAPTLSNFVDGLPDLALFHANSNNFSGTVPDLSGLPFFQELDVSNNKMSGGFPTTVLRLVNLTFLDLRFNYFAGSVPPSIFALSLDVLFINNNRFDQPIPDELGKSKVSYLTLANNGFTGPIPTSICNASNSLIQVLFLNNRLSGCLPGEIGQLKEATVFDAGFNQLTGPLPYSFGCLLKIEQLNLAVNQLFGEVPDVVCRLATVGKLLNLSLSDNYFTKLGPSCWFLIKTGVLNVRRNCISGLPDQRTLAECNTFQPQCVYCPLHRYMPCKHSSLAGDDVGVDAHPASLVAPAHRTYSALQRPGGIN